MLEKLYRDNKKEFTKSFSELSGEFQSDLVAFWKLRLAPDAESDSKKFLKLDLIVVIVLSMVTGFLAKLPQLFSQIDLESFYFRDLAIIVFNGLILYTFWQKRMMNAKTLLAYGLTLFALTGYVNLLPYNCSDSINLALIHLPITLWFLLGLAFTSFDFKDLSKRIEFIRFSGELLVMTYLILLAGGILTGISLGLFSVINIDIEQFYLQYVIVFGGVASPIVSCYLIRLYPNITSKIAPVIARIFTPLVLITLTAYLIALIFSGSKIFEDRNLLMVFNVMLLCVLALIFFSIAELDKTKGKSTSVLILLLLATLAIVIDSIALIAIVSRVLNGLTPNRTAVLVSNVLVFVNLIIIAIQLIKSYFKGHQLDTVEQSVARFLPVYFAWTLFVVVFFPLVFGFK
jgi:hypothetical protein